MVKKKNQKFKYVYFDLPFVLFVRDGMSDPDLQRWAEAYTKGETPLPYSRYAPGAQTPGKMVIGGGFPIYLPPDDLAPFYLVNLTNIQVALRFLKRVNPHRNTILMGELPGDRTGKASFTSVQATFSLKQIKKEFHDHMELFCDLSIEATNKFIEHYRVIADRPYITTVNKQIIQEFLLKTEYEDGTSKAQEFGSGGGPLIGFGGSISESQDEKIRQAIQADIPPDINHILDLNVRDYLDLNDWRMALLEIGIFFEFWTTKFVRSKFKEIGLTESKIQDKFRRANGLPKSITAIAKNLILESTGFDFEKTQEYKDWETYIRNPRNDIAHGKKFNVTKNEAQLAYKSLKAAIKSLESQQ